MKNRFTYILLYLLLPSLLFADSTKVLFIGNSYTYVNDLPVMFANISSSLGKAVYTDMSAPGGYSYEQHLTNTETLQKISKGNWTYVVLQEQSQMPVIEYFRNYSTYPSARKLDSIIKSYNSSTMFFMTWGRRYGGIQCIDTSCSPPFVNFSHMQDSLSAAYLRIANELGDAVCRAGNVWRQSVSTDSTVVLWDSDFSHPSLAGTYLTACAFYAKIFNSSCIGSSYSGGLPPSTALYLQTIASNYVLNVNVSEKEQIPDFIVNENYPNPFNSSTVISFEVNSRSKIDINIYDSEGRLKERLSSGIMNPGKHRIFWKANSNLPSGIYYLTLNNDRFLKTRKLVYLK